MNQVILIGNLTRDPEMKYTQSGLAITRFTLALNRPKKDGQDQGADFINIVTFGKLAENCANYLAKGGKTAVSGRINSGSYEDKDGKKVYTVDVIANSVEFLEWGDKKESSGTDYSDIDGFHPTDNDDIPF
ncbi:single-stranded DNA-binding protein [Gudongella sp. SC589]|uniref:single-stranded DNA-binding protein n=1 Tax=Gudongella sp. SC589 TaxID=3385990 RepID=UPI003904717D